MHRLYKLLIVFSLLAGQFLLVTHAYEEHDAEHPCEVCITLKQQEQGIEVSTPGLLIDASNYLVATKSQLVHQPEHVTFFSVRAPPSLV